MLKTILKSVGKAILSSVLNTFHVSFGFSVNYPPKKEKEKKEE